MLAHWDWARSGKRAGLACGLGLHGGARLRFGLRLSLPDGLLHAYHISALSFLCPQSERDRVLLVIFVGFFATNWNRELEGCPTSTLFLNIYFFLFKVGQGAISAVQTVLVDRGPLEICNVYSQHSSESD
jgi:hypothetical protein